MGKTLDFLMDHAGSGSISFHMPGHKGAAFFRRFGYGPFLERIADCDVTEIRGADNLFHADGILQDAAAKYARIYGASRSFLLVNGTSCGIMAAVTACVPQGGRMIMARNCHKSVFNAVRIGGIKPYYVYPSLIEGYGISGPVMPADIEAALADAPDAAAVMITSPDYYGICSDIAAIAELVHGAGKVLIVDQAHGAHLKLMEGFGGLPLSAETAGADVVIGSIHKTLGSFTQSAVLNVCSGRVSQRDLEDWLQMFESSSPSYILMASLDIAASVMEEHGEIFRGWAEALDAFYERCGKWLMERSPHLDHTKLNIDASKLGLSGAALADRLMERGIEPELWTGDLVMCMTGIGTTAEHLDRLAQALEEIAGAGGAAPASGAVSGGSAWTRRRETFAVTGPEISLPLEESAGMLCAQNIIPYPPGIPLVCRGEEILAEDVAYLASLLESGCDVLGIGPDRTVRCVRPVQ